jgi:CRISPR type III-B/RAMP module-associated protein Cmr5
MKMLDQCRAEFAWKMVCQAGENKGEVFEKYVSLVKKLPAMIHANSLGQTLAFLAGKAGMDRDGTVKPGSAEGLLYSQLQSWLSHEDGQFQGPYLGSSNLLQSIHSQDSSSYRRANLETLAILSYMRNFASGLK